jgi:hypothetical protein
MAARNLSALWDRGRVVPEIGDSAVREVFVFRYRMVYRVQADRVEIIAFVHGARDFATLHIRGGLQVRACWAIAALLSVGGADVATLQHAAAQGPGGLNPRIPAAIHASYQDIRDAQEWLNPKITIRAEGIEVESAGIPNGRKTVPADEFRNLLISLPVRAWPYGRVVLASDIGPRRADRSDDEPIRRNHEAAEKILEALDVKIDWWPS